MPITLRKTTRSVLPAMNDPDGAYTRDGDGMLHEGVRQKNFLADLAMKYQKKEQEKRVNGALEGFMRDFDEGGRSPEVVRELFANPDASRYGLKEKDIPMFRETLMSRIAAATQAEGAVMQGNVNRMKYDDAVRADKKAEQGRQVENFYSTNADQVARLQDSLNHFANERVGADPNMNHNQPAGWRHNREAIIRKATEFANQEWGDTMPPHIRHNIVRQAVIGALERRQQRETDIAPPGMLDLLTKWKEENSDQYGRFDPIAFRRFEIEKLRENGWNTQAEARETELRQMMDAQPEVEEEEMGAGGGSAGGAAQEEMNPFGDKGSGLVVDYIEEGADGERGLVRGQIPETRYTGLTKATGGRARVYRNVNAYLEEERGLMAQAEALSFLSDNNQLLNFDQVEEIDNAIAAAQKAGADPRSIQVLEQLKKAHQTGGMANVTENIKQFANNILLDANRIYAARAKAISEGGGFGGGSGAKWAYEAVKPGEDMALTDKASEFLTGLAAGDMGRAGSDAIKSLVLRYRNRQNNYHKNRDRYLDELITSQGRIIDARPIKRDSDDWGQERKNYARVILGVPYGDVPAARAQTPAQQEGTPDANTEQQANTGGENVGIQPSDEEVNDRFAKFTSDQMTSNISGVANGSDVETRPEGEADGEDATAKDALLKEALRVGSSQTLNPPSVNTATQSPVTAQVGEQEAASTPVTTNATKPITASGSVIPSQGGGVTVTPNFVDTVTKYEPLVPIGGDAKQTVTVVGEDGIERPATVNDIEPELSQFFDEVLQVGGDPQPTLRAFLADDIRGKTGRAPSTKEMEEGIEEMLELLEIYKRSLGR